MGITISYETAVPCGARGFLSLREGRTVLDHVQHPRSWPWSESWVGVTRTNTEMKPLKDLLRKYFTIVIRKCVIGGNAEHPSRNRMKHLAPRMASFLF